MPSEVTSAPGSARYVASLIAARCRQWDAIPPEDPCDCWFTVLAGGFDPWSIYDGPPGQLRSGAIEFIRDDCESGDLCTCATPPTRSANRQSPPRRGST